MPKSPRTPKNTVKVRRQLREGDRIPLYVDVKLVRDLEQGRSVTVSLNGQRITMHEQYLPLVEEE